MLLDRTSLDYNGLQISSLNKWASGPCGELLQTRQHILAECPQYEEHRYLLRDASRGLSLPVLLGTKKGIAALTEFIAASGAFTKTGAPRAPPSLPTWEQEPEVRQDDENGEDG
ncbi:uncharacterized protein SCHCODRAFT_02482788 [Schizophyllum commune H4-8]|nr:uncharacterized protein SCHCODRAFT_02482788 [Schizophyllum commune H4-8]KAI5899232.1 hypothetical protein SCHCODRAFT_02482788 [Schizophyllum commune H4-8]